MGLNINKIYHDYKARIRIQGDLPPIRNRFFEHDVDSVYFNTDNSVVLKVTVFKRQFNTFSLHDKGYFSNLCY
jgi:alpha-glucosidase